MKPAMDDSFLTIAAPSEGVYKSKGSKFLAFAYPIHDENDAKAHIDALRKKYFDARHHCYAWRVGTASTEGVRFRTSDDGEPSNSAGKPIMGQLVASGLTNVLVIVVRYFGGILLGVGGLMQAYKLATADALANAQTTTGIVSATCRLDFDYADMNNVIKVVKDMKAEVVSQTFDLQCTTVVKVRKSFYEAFSKKLKVFNSLKIKDLN